MATRIAISHGHDHAHPAGHEDYAARPHPEQVVLDIGDEFGALIIYAPPGMHGTEIEISPRGADDERSHKEVLERLMGDRPAFTAVFEKLPEGKYTLWINDTFRLRNVQIRGGEITQLDWSD